MKRIWFVLSLLAMLQNGRPAPEVTLAKAEYLDGRAWELNVYAQNQLLLKKIIDGTGSPERKWESIRVDLSAYGGQQATLRLYQRVLIPNRTAGNAYWRDLRIE